MKVACYVRVSTEEQVKFGLSIDAQKNDLTNYCKEHNYKYELFIDEGVSASSMNRNSLKEMLSRIEEFDMVLFTKLDRLSRNVLDANSINNLLKTNNVVMKAIFEDDIDTSTADGKFIFDLKCSLAERELGKTSERIKQVFDYKVKVLHEVVSGKLPYGYKIENKHIIIDEEKAAKFKECVDLLITTGSIRKAFDWFKLNCAPMRYDGFRAMIRKEAYNGKYDYHGENIEDYYPKILSDEVYANLHSVLAANIRYCAKRVRKIYYFTGIVYCGNCGYKYSSDSFPSAHGKVVKYYRCRKYDGKCTAKMIKEEYLESYMINKVLEGIKLKNIKVSEKGHKNYDKEIESLKNKIKRLQDLFINEGIDIIAFKERKKELDDRIIELTQKNAKKAPKIDIKAISDALEVYNTFTDEEKRSFWHLIIKNIVIYSKDNIKFEFN